MMTPKDRLITVRENAPKDQSLGAAARSIASKKVLMSNSRAITS